MLYTNKALLLAIESDPMMLRFVSIALGVVLIGFVLRYIKQTHVIIYIITGVVLGPSVSHILDNPGLIHDMGNLGLILLLFFMGMEISLPKLVANWKIAVIGTLVQIFLSVGAVWAIGYLYSWPMARVLTIGFVISLSSTAVVVKLLQENNEMESKVGQAVLGILLVQDIMIVPMLLTLNYISGAQTTTTEVVLQLVGAVLVAGFVVFLLRKPNIKMPFHRLLNKDHEIQVFFAFGLCFGFSALTGFFGLSTALGAFMAGLLVAASKTTQWFHDSLYTLKVIFVALFFISVGMLIDLQFLVNNILAIALLVFAIFLTNNIINALAMRLLKLSWREAIHGGAVLSQIGEFSFVIGNLALLNEFISDMTYQMVVSVISLSLLFSPFWNKLTNRFTHTVALRVKPKMKTTD